MQNKLSRGRMFSRVRARALDRPIKALPLRANEPLL